MTIMPESTVPNLLGSIQLPAPQIPSSRIGWQCPRCNSSVNPDLKTCPVCSGGSLGYYPWTPPLTLPSTGLPAPLVPYRNVPVPGSQIPQALQDAPVQVSSIAYGSENIKTVFCDDMGCDAYDATGKYAGEFLNEDFNFDNDLRDRWLYNRKLK